MKRCTAVLFGTVFCHDRVRARLESLRKRHRSEGESVAASCATSISLEWRVRSNHQEGGSSGNGSALPTSAPVEKRGLEQEIDMTDAAVQLQGGAKEVQGAPNST